MKQLFKEMGYFALFVGMLLAFNVALKTAWLCVNQAYDGDINVMTAVYTLVVLVAMAGAAVHVYGWLHKFVAKTRGVPAAQKILAKQFEALEAAKAAAEKTVQDLVGINERLRNDLAASEELAGRLIDENLRKAPPVMVEQHFDDWALNQFVTQLRAKLKSRREMGRAGWNDCQLTILHDLLVQEVESLNVEKMDMVDIGNYAMMCWARNAFPAECESAALKPVRQIEA